MESELKKKLVYFYSYRPEKGPELLIHIGKCPCDVTRERDYELKCKAKHGRDLLVYIIR